MNEKVLKRRAWIKNIAIIFLAVLLVLTFFSNTFLNYSLPEISAQYPQFGTITAKVRGSGVVEANQQYEVTINETRTLASVAVKAGDAVTKGQVLFTLEETESEELKTAQDTLAELQAQYDKALIENNTADYSTELLEIKNAEEDLAKARTSRDKIPQRQQAVRDASEAAAAAQQKVDDLIQQIGALEAAIGEMDPKEDQEAIQKAQKNLQTLNGQLESASSELAAAQTRLADAEALNTMTPEEAEDKITELERMVENLRNALRLKQEEDSRTQSVSNIDMELLKRSLDNQAAEVERLQKQKLGTEVTAGVSGIISDVLVVAGEQIEAGAVLAQIQISDKGYSIRYTVTQEQARNIKEGDGVAIQYYYWDENAKAKVQSIQNDPENPGKSKIVTIAIEGDVTPGETLYFTVGERGTEYDTLVPNSAIHEDNSGKFVLAVVSKSTPLGNRYTATRMDVQVLASDEISSAVSGVLSSDFIVTSSSSPLEPGTQVRLIDTP